MSYGRASVVFQWANHNWSYFDSWCCLKNIDPLELPAYRFYNLTLYAIKEGMTAEELIELDSTFRLCDSQKHPLHELLHVNRGVTQYQEAPRPEEKQKYVPPWYRGEEASAKIALATMPTLPK